MERNSTAFQNGTDMQKTMENTVENIEQRAPTPSSNIMSVAFRNLSVHAFGRQTDYQRTVSNFFGAVAANWVRKSPRFRIDILHQLNGVVSSGEMLLVLGNPGSGCTTMLKALAGQTYDIYIDEEAAINYQGLSSRQMFTEFRGKGTYQAEFDVHFPSLTMRETLEFAYRARRPPKYWELTEATVENDVRCLGLSKSLDTKMGNAYIPGVSGGERKRTSIAEILLGDSVLQCWDNSTRGLDSANALDFVKTLRRRTTENRSVAIVTLYQAGEDIYNVMVLHEGRQIYFGSTRNAKKYFTDLGYIPPARSTTPEFLTSVTRPLDLRPQTRDGIGWLPRTAEDFEQRWTTSPEYETLINEIDTYNAVYPLGDEKNLRVMRRELKGTPYALSIPMQIGLCVNRGFLRLRHNLAVPISTIVGNFVTSLILGSMFYNMKEDTDSFFGRGVLLFFTSLVNTTLAAFESVALWDDRPIIEKHAQYGFYHPFTEAVASFICDLPNKLVLTFVFNCPLYFLSNLRRTPGAFFTYYLFGLMCLLNGSVIYRSMGAMSRTLAGSQPPGAVLVVLLTIYSGFVVPFKDMRPWLQCFLDENLPVTNSSLSRMMTPCHLFALQLELDRGKRPYREITTLPNNLDLKVKIFGEFITMLPPRSDVLLFQKGHMPSSCTGDDEEKGRAPRDSARRSKYEKKDDYYALERSDGAHLLWSGLTYKIKVGKEEKVILDNIDGWVKPGTLTALMGSSGAGKTTLLNVLADRVSIGVVTGSKVVDTCYQNVAFSRKIGYAQQEDIHLETASVIESLTFSALLRQPEHYSREEKLEYVHHVIEMLDMQAFQHAVVGQLNVEQKKRVTIGTELAARPELLLFLDEPTSGLDSDSSWTFCTLLRRLTDSGQAILCTIHQPSSPILTLFDRLLFLKEGHTAYFGEFGPEFRTLIRYFESHGARKCLPHENPAEWMMEVTSMDKAGHSLDWGEIWDRSAECAAVKNEYNEMRQRLSKATTVNTLSENRATEFATTFWYQLGIVTKRAFQHDWRSPEYLYSKSLTTFGYVGIFRICSESRS
ncbi:hypothetical protein Daesc_007160 [Daldinia eschscholtzii]|uniref:ABC transporter domain-containing protein n=1 Tax=Daldinia eschscholtzii TaxID=292717 RepID=A0AAX6MDY3_9PEZI